MNFIYLLLFSETVLLFIIMISSKMDYSSPAFITVSMFILSTFCATYNVELWDVHFSLKAYFYVMAGLNMVAIVDYLSRRIYHKTQLVWIDRPTVCNSKPIRINGGVRLTFNICVFLMMVYFVLTIMRFGGGGLSAISVVKFADDLKIPAAAKACLRILRVIQYPCLFIVMFNMIVCGDKFKKNIGLVLPIFFSCIVIFFSGSRGPYTYMIFASYIYMVMFERYKHGWRNIDIKKYIKPIIIAVIVFLFIFFGTRTIVKGYAISETATQYITFYFGSPIHLLSKLLDNPTKAYPHAYSIPGANVFVSFFEELYKFGLFNEEIHLGQTGFMYIGGKAVGGGNAYSMFGSIYNDFGYVGAVVFVGVFYWIVNYFYYKKIKYSKSIIRHQVDLLIFGYFSYLIFMQFFVNTVIYLKMQTLLEVLVMVVTYKILIKVRIGKNRIKRYKEI